MHRNHGRRTATGWASILLALGLPAAALADTAETVWNGYSFRLDPLRRANESVMLMLTTWDDDPKFPLLDETPNAPSLPSGEMSPLEPGSIDYRANYIRVDDLGNMYEWGAVYYRMTTFVDENDNGIADVLELSHFGNFRMLGDGYSDHTVGGVDNDIAIEGSVRRTAGLREGAHSGSVTDSPFVEDFTGDFYLSGAAGTVAYEPGGDTLDWALSFRAADRVIYDLTGRSTLTVTKDGELELSETVLEERRTRTTLVVRPMTLERRADGDYLGTAEFIDGNPETSWPDYLYYRVELSDFDPIPEPEHGTLILAALATLGALRPGRPT